MTKDEHCTENIPNLKLIIVVLSVGIIITNVYWLALVSSSKYELLTLSVINEVQNDNSINLILSNEGYFPVEIWFIKVNEEYISVYTIQEFIVNADSSISINVDFNFLINVPPMNFLYNFMVYTRSKRVYWIQWVGLP